METARLDPRPQVAQETALVEEWQSPESKYMRTLADKPSRRDPRSLAASTTDRGSRNGAIMLLTDWGLRRGKKHRMGRECFPIVGDAVARASIEFTVLERYRAAEVLWAGHSNWGAMQLRHREEKRRVRVTYQPNWTVSNIDHIAPRRSTTMLAANTDSFVLVCNSMSWEQS